MIDKLYEKITSFENLHRAYHLVRRGKRYKEKQQRFEFNLEIKLVKLRKKLINPKQYKPQVYQEFTIYEPKMRKIHAPKFKDRIVHRAVFEVIEPMVRKNFINNTYACIKERGTHRAVQDLHQAVKDLGDKNSFYFKTDIRHYFESIDQQILKNLLREHLDSKKTLTLLDIIIDSYKPDLGRGVPLGNVTSQLFANIYLNKLDHFVKKNLINKSSSTYFRYMDDFIILSENKNFLIGCRDKIAKFLKKELKLKLHPRKNLIQQLRFGVDFCGYQVYTDRVLLRKKTVRRFVRRYKKKKSKIEALEQKLAMTLLPKAFPEINQEIKQLKANLSRSVTSHLGFLGYAQLGFEKKDYISVNRIRLPYLPKAVRINYD